MQSSDKKPSTVANTNSNANAKRKLRKEKNEKNSYKKNVSSDDDISSEEDDEDEEQEPEPEVKEKEKFDKKKYIEMLADMFPSRHMTERLKQMKKNDKVTNNKNVTNNKVTNNKVTNNKVTNNKDTNNKIAKKSEAFKKWANHVKSNRRVEPNKKASEVSVVKRRRLNKAIVSESEETSEAEEEVDEAKESEEAEEEDDSSYKEEEEEDDDSSYKEEASEEEDDSDSSYREEEEEEDDEEDYEDECTDDEEDEEEEYDSDGEKIISSGKVNVNNPGRLDTKYNIILSVGNPMARRNNQDDYFQDDDAAEEEETEEKMKDENENTLIVYNEKEAEALASLKKMISSLTEKEKKNKTIVKMLTDFEKREKAYNKGLEKHIAKLKEKNTRKLSNLMSEKNVMNDVKYFHEKMSVEEQYKVLKQMLEIKSHNIIVKPYRLALLDADIPVQYKAIAYKKINTLKYMEQGGGEYYKIKNWVDTFMQIPFGKTKNLPVTIEDGVEKCHDFMEKANKILDEAVYGLDDVKLQIMQMVGQWISNPKAMGTAIAIKGPMGTGKTSLVKEGISKILGREFAFIALGGATDSSFLEGHSYTYEGSSWGKIVDILVKCQSMNPVIFFDELDKVSDTAKGEEIIGILTHLTDTTQNSKFHDKYFSELEFDLSKCLFIFSYNDERKVNPILKDRMYRIETKGYESAEKFVISKDYLLPKICEQVKFAKDDIVIPEETIKYLIANHTDEEQGVRNLKRCLEIIYTKLNLYRLMKPGSNLFKKEMSLDIKFPMTITVDIVDKLIKKNENENWTHRIMYM
jgi:hypothetical protein